MFWKKIHGVHCHLFSLKPTKTFPSYDSKPSCIQVQTSIKKICFPCFLACSICDPLQDVEDNHWIMRYPGLGGTHKHWVWLLINITQPKANDIDISHAKLTYISLFAQTLIPLHVDKEQGVLLSSSSFCLFQTT